MGRAKHSAASKDQKARLNDKRRLIERVVSTFKKTTELISDLGVRRATAVWLMRKATREGKSERVAAETLGNVPGSLRNAS